MLVAIGHLTIPALNACTLVFLQVQYSSFADDWNQWVSPVQIVRKLPKQQQEQKQVQKGGDEANSTPSDGKRPLQQQPNKVEEEENKAR